MDPKEASRSGSCMQFFSRDPGIFCVVAVRDSGMALEGNECGASSSLAPYVLINSHFFSYSALLPYQFFLDDADFALSSSTRGL